MLGTQRYFRDGDPLDSIKRDPHPYCGLYLSQRGERFREQPDAAAKTDAIVKTSNWDRGDMVEKSGYATMPGSKTADSDVARACAEILATPVVPKS